MPFRSCNVCVSRARSASLPQATTSHRAPLGGSETILNPEFPYGRGVAGVAPGVVGAAVDASAGGVVAASDGGGSGGDGTGEETGRKTVPDGHRFISLQISALPSFTQL